tara:strand:+ start:4565 stop:5050 length:486 start_codon:yes stop_codon:yes gene_type:complete
MILKYVLIVLSFYNTSAFANSQPFNTIPLVSQNGKNINWNDYETIIVGSKTSSDLAQEWSQKISEYKKIRRDEICAVACVPKWMLKTMTARFIIKKSICMYESKIPIFIDWSEEFAKLNGVDSYPTVIIVKHDKRGSYEVGRIVGKLNTNTWNKYLDIDNI